MEHNNNSFMKGALIGALSMFIFGGVAIAAFFMLTQGGSTVISSSTIDKLEVIYAYIEQESLYDVDAEALEEGIFYGYMDAIGDTYAAYYNEEETLELLESTSGEYYGIGVSILQDTTTGIITVIEVFEGSPAEEAGMQSGDILERINGEDITGEDVNNVVAAIKGETGTTVDITVIRGATSYESITLTVTRELVEYPTVYYEMLEDQIGYIQVTAFETATLGQFEEALQELETREMEGLVVDLRNNTGGNLDTVCEMLELILPEGLIVYTEDKDGTRSEIYSSGEHEFTKPLVVLVNGYSASASEIFAGAVQDYGIGELVGTTTYGKGVVQQLISLSDNTMIKFTTSEYFTPLGRNIDGTGIEPDVEVEYDYTDLDTDEQLEKAIEVIQSLE